MSETKTMRLSQVARKLNVGMPTITSFLSAQGFSVESNPNSKVTMEQFRLLAREFESSALDKEEASSIMIGVSRGNEGEFNEPAPPVTDRSATEEEKVIIRGTRYDEPAKPKPAPNPAPQEKAAEAQAPAPQAAPAAEAKPADVAKPAAGAKPAEAAKPAAEARPAAPAQPPKADASAPTDAAPTAGKPAEATKPAAEPAAPAPKPPVAARPDGLKILGKIELPPPGSAGTRRGGGSPRGGQPDRRGGGPVRPAPIEANRRGERPGTRAPERPAAPVARPAATLSKPAVTAAVRTQEATSPPPVEKPAEPEVITSKADQLKGLTVLGKIELPEEKKRGVGAAGDKKRKRKRVQTNKTAGRTAVPEDASRRDNSRGPVTRGAKKPVRGAKEEPTDKEIQEQIKATLARLSGGKGNARSRYRRDRRSAAADAREERILQEQQDAKLLKVTEFISANDLASLMGVSVNQVISTCLSLGMFVSINQRLDAEAITIIADEFGFEVEFQKEEEETVLVEEDDPDTLVSRAPIVTIMGHVDHGKTSLLDYIRSTKVTAQEAGGITQHIGAYDVMTRGEKPITFLDTPGHEAFTAMRARGAKVTDVAIIVVAADDSVMPQTKEAINHAQVAGVPIIIALNKVDKPGADPEKVRGELANINILVEEWGGKYQSQEVSAKTGQGIPELLEKVLLEAEMLDLKANPTKRAIGTVVEATLDKGRGYTTTILIQSGTLNVGDVVLAGAHYGRVRAMTDDTGARIKKAGPSKPVQVLGLNGAPQAGDVVRVMESEREARDIATRREQIMREQTIRTRKHITLDEIGRRLAIGTFKELNVILKGDVDGSIEALSDSLLKLSTEEVQVNIIHKAVGQVSESDVLLASASDAVIIGFQVRPSPNARKLAEQEEIEIRLYSIIYDAINDLKDAMEGMLSPKVEEVITGSVDVREVFKITKVGTVAGCYVTEGTIKRNSTIRLVRDGIVVYTGKVGTLRRFKEDVAEVRSGYECGIAIEKYNDIRESDVIEVFEQRETKRTL